MNLEQKSKEDWITMELRSGLETLMNLPNRFVTLIWKIIGWKGVIVALTVFLIYADKIKGSAIPYVWIAITVIVVFDKKALDIIGKIKR